MSTFVVCTRCGTTQEISGPDRLPKLWRQTEIGLLCPRHAAMSTGDVASDVIDEEILYPSNGLDDTTLNLTEEFKAFSDACEVCKGPCRGH